MKLEKILVIEDNEKHIEDAKNLLEDRIKVGAIGGVDYATNLESAMEYLENNEYAGVLSDVFFPSYEGGSEKENGTKIGAHSLERGLPITLITSTHHHGRKTEPVNKWACSKKISLIDAYPQDDNGEVSTKNWISGYLNLMFLVGSKSNGNIEINNEGINGSIEISKTDPKFKEILNKYCQGMFEGN